MTKTLERNLVAMTPSDREVAISQLHQIRLEVAKYSKAYFWRGRGKVQWETKIRIELGADVIDFYSKYYETKRCHYTNSLTLNGERMNPAEIEVILDKLYEINAPAVPEPIFLGEDELFL